MAQKGKPGETHIVPTYKAAHKALKFVSWSFPETKQLQCTQVNTDWLYIYIYVNVRNGLVFKNMAPV